MVAVTHQNSPRHRPVGNRTRLIEADGTRITWSYDGDGQRTGRETSVSTKKFVWDLENILLETNAADTTQVVYTMQPAQYGNLVSQRRSGMSSYYLFDALGSVERLIDPSEDNLVIYVNTAFGGPRYESTAAENNFRWVGRLGYYYDATLYAAYYVRARYYDYFTARWLSEDMVRAIEDQLNLYLYSSNNPILDTDPSGLKPQWQLDCEGCFTPKGTPPPSGIPKIGEPCYYPNRLVRAPNSIWYQSQCVCQCAGDSPNFNDVRACIKCADERGAPRNTIEAEEYCRHKVVYTENEQKRIDCCVNTDWNQGGCAIPFFLLNNAQNYLNPNPQAKSCTDLPIP